MAHFFKTWDDTDIAKDKITPSAFCQARLKLKPEAFIELNSRMVRYFYNHADIDTWYGESVISVEQDFHAKVFVKNLAAALVHPMRPIVAAATAHRKYEYRFNFTQALSKIKNTVVLLFKEPDLNRLLNDLIEVLVRLTEPIRPDRKNKRKKRSGGRRFYPAYKTLS